MEMVKYKLGELLENYDYLRKPLSAMERAVFQGVYPYYGAQGIIDYVREYKCDGEYLLIAEDGENLSSRKEPIAHIAKGKFWVNNHAHIVRTNNKADLRYILYLLNTSDITGYITGAAQPKLSQANLNKIILEIPSIIIQRKIASILSAYDSLIENNTKRIRLLEQMAENLYKEWFVRFRFPGYENTEFVNGLPKGWKVCKIKDCYKTCSGGTPNREKAEYYTNGNIYWVKTGEIQDSIIFDTEEKITLEALKHSSAKLLPQNSLLMAMYGVNIGKLGILTRQMSCNQAACAFLPNDEKQTFYYLFFYLKSIRGYLISIGFGAAQQNLSQATINNIRITVPHESILNCFEQKIALYYKQIEFFQRQSFLLTRQRDLLLPRLMSGKLEVKSIKE